MIKVGLILVLAAICFGILPTPNYAQGTPTAKEFLKTVLKSNEPLMVEGERVYRSGEVTRRAVIKLKPEPQFTDKARQKKTEGLVELLVMFRSNGEVKILYVLKRLPHGLTEQAAKAAARIQFTPATLDDKPVSQIMLLQYNFNRS